MVGFRREKRMWQELVEPLAGLFRHRGRLGMFRLPGLRVFLPSYGKR